MKVLSLWLLSITLFAFAVLVFPTSLIASIPLLISGLYLLPIVRKIAPLSLQNGFFMSWKGGLLIVSTLVITSTFIVSSAQDKFSENLALEEYKSDPETFIESAKEALNQKDFFAARYKLDMVIPSVPENESLKMLRHRITLEEIKFSADQGKLFQFSRRELNEYKELINDPSLLAEIEDLFGEKISAAVKKHLKQKDDFAASREMERLRELFPESSLVLELNALIAPIKEENEIKRAAQAKKNAEQEAAKRIAEGRTRSPASASTPSDMCLVTKVLHNTGWMCKGGNVCGVDKASVVTINGQTLTENELSLAGNFIRPGYRCTCKSPRGRIHADIVECQG